MISHRPSAWLTGSSTYPYSKIHAKRRLPNRISQRLTRCLLCAVVMLAVVILSFFSPIQVHEIQAPNPSSSSPPAPSNIPPKNVAVIIEERPLDTLAPLLLHFSTVLGPSWPIILYTAPSQSPLNSASLDRAIDGGRITVRELPSFIHFASDLGRSAFLTQPWFWDQLAPAEHILLFQADSILCSNSKQHVDDFLEYDFAGAPSDISLGCGEGFSGGLSLRKRKTMLDIVKNGDWNLEIRATEHEGSRESKVEAEDKWFYRKMKGMPGVKLPSVEVARTFAVESMWGEKPLGFHRVERRHTMKMDKVYEWCPEYRVAANSLLVRHRSLGLGGGE